MSPAHSLGAGYTLENRGLTFSKSPKHKKPWELLAGGRQEPHAEERPARRGQEAKSLGAKA